MEDVKIQGTVVSMKFDNDAEKSNPDEFNINDSIKALGDEFSTVNSSEFQTVTTISEPKK